MFECVKILWVDPAAVEFWPTVWEKDNWLTVR